VANTRAGYKLRFEEYGKLLHEKWQKLDPSYSAESNADVDEDAMEE